VKEDRIHRFEWFEVECTDPIEYQLQVAPKRKESDFKTVSKLNKIVLHGFLISLNEI